MALDGGIESGPLTPGQAREWAGLLAEIARADGDDEVFGEADLLEDFDNQRHHFPRGSLALRDDGQLVGYNILVLRENRPEIRQEGGVRPGYRGRGLGAELLAWSEQAARTLHQE